MHIAVYSGSFNPLHIGHLSILKHLSDDSDIDRIYLVVSPKNPLKEGISCASAGKRLHDAQEAVRRHDLPKVDVCDIELGMPEPHYTIRTLDKLRETEPENRFTLIMGADQIADIHRWKDFDRILTEYGALVYPRKGFELQNIIKTLQKENKNFHIGIINALMVDVSSTMIRNGLAEGKDMTEYLM